MVVQILKSIAVIAVTGFFASGIAGAVAEDLLFPQTNPDCAPQPKFAVVDLSLPTPPVKTPAGTAALKVLKEEFKVDTVFRYYDHPDETLDGKTLLPAESDAIIKAGLKIGVVFQHHNDDPGKFLDPDAGKKDAERALVLADANLQPFDTAIYFGIDGPEYHFDRLIAEYRQNDGREMSPERKSELSSRGQASRNFVKSYGNFLQYGPGVFHMTELDKVKPEMMRPVIEKYFKDIKTAFNAYSQRNGGKGYKIGMYCTAAMCGFGADNGWAQYFWLSPEQRGLGKYREFLKRKADLNLVQELKTVCAGWGPTPDHKPLELDFNQVNPDKPELGQWAQKRPR
jgi:hypothetical protein